MDPSAPHRLSFYGFELSLGDRLLRRDGRSVEVTPKALDLLILLARNRDRVVPKEELGRELWPGVVNIDQPLASTLSRLRRVLAPHAQRIVETRRRVGYRFIAPLEVVSEARPPGTAPFVGRERERARLRDLISGNEGPRGIVVFGEQGIGKSRLVAEVLEDVGDSVEVFRARCPAVTGDPGLWLWARVLSQARERSLAQGESDPQSAEIEALVADIERLTGVKSASSGSDAALADRTVELGTKVFRTRAEKRPVTLVLEDLHRSSPAVRSVALRFVKAFAGVPATVVGPWRGGRREAARSFNGSPRVEVLEIGALKPPEIAAVATAEKFGMGQGEVGQALGARPESELTELLASTSGGNPFYLIELLRAGPEVYAVERNVADATAHRPIPDAIKTRIEGRLSELEGSARILLGSAAVIGTQFSLRLAERLAITDVPGEIDGGDGRGAQASDGSKADRSDFDSWWAEIVDAGLVRSVTSGALTTEASPENGNTFAFVHGVVHEHVYKTLPKVARRIRHRQVAAALERVVAAGAAEAIFATTDHWLNGADANFSDAASRWALTAARRALGVGDYATAVGYASRGVEVLGWAPTPAPERAVQLLLIVAGAELQRGAVGRARGALEEAERLLSTIDSPRSYAGLRALRRQFHRSEPSS